MEHHGYSPGDFIPCKVCGGLAVDIHHIRFRSKFGKNKKHEQDHHSNLVALCREHHNKAHSDKSFNDSFLVASN